MVDQGWCKSNPSQLYSSINQISHKESSMSKDRIIDVKSDSVISPMYLQFRELDDEVAVAKKRLEMAVDARSATLKKITEVTGKCHYLVDGVIKEIARRTSDSSPTGETWYFSKPRGRKPLAK